MNLTRTGFIPTRGFDRESHQDGASDENFSTSSGQALSSSLSSTSVVVSRSFPGELASLSIDDDDVDDDDDDDANDDDDDDDANDDDDASDAGKRGEERR